MAKRSFKLAASIICADVLNLKREIKILEKSQIDFIHFDVMDGVFVPRLGLFPEILKAISSITAIPIEVHMMTINPDLYIKSFIQAGAERIVIHAESTKHLHRTIQAVRENGALAGIALNPATPLNVLDYILEDIWSVTLMGINPGIVGHKLIPGTLRKIADLKIRLSEKKIFIEVDGGVTAQSAPKMIKMGADILVCGSQTIFKPKSEISGKVLELRKTVNKSLLGKL